MSRTVPVAVLALLLGGCAVRDSFPAPPAAAAATPPEATAAHRGYLDPGLLARLGAETAARPDPGSAAEAADRAASEALRTLEDTPRWTLAQTHAEVSPALAVAHFDCPLGTRLSQDPPPALVRLLTRAIRDASAASTVAKDRDFRPRPFVDDPQRRICLRSDPTLAENSSHPSGHGVVGALFGEIMAEVAPDAAAEMRRRGAEIAFSRAVCGLHYPADVESGVELGRALHAAMRTEPAYRADLEAARAEVVQARGLGRTNPGCASERAALALATAPY